MKTFSCQVVSDEIPVATQFGQHPLYSVRVDKPFFSVIPSVKRGIFLQLQGMLRFKMSHYRSNDFTEARS